MKPSEAAEILEGIEEFRGNLPEDGLLVEEAVSMAISALEKQEQDRWIPVTERLPEEDCSCRVTEGDFKSVFDCYWSNHKKQFEFWSYYNDCYMPITNVTAWKPIEEPYTEDEA